MCGIVGVLGRELSPEVLDTLAHRGPDGRGIEEVPVGSRSVWLGHTRLAILDLSPAGHQPMASRDGRWWVVFNGEIYNHLELRRFLEGPLRGHSDTETLVELIASQGIESALSRLNGMFAFAALDRRHGRLYLARDPFGIKPLYYGHSNGCFAFASEVKALQALGFGGGLDVAGLRQFLALRYVPSPYTLWAGIRRLAPGHLLCLDMAEEMSVRCKPYIRPRRSRFTGTQDEAVAMYQEKMSQAVKRQLLADVPVGVLLSGGVDSALVAAMAKDTVGQRLPCFTVGFGEESSECEIGEARLTAKVLGLPFQSVTVTPEGLREALSDIVQSVEEPLGTTSIMPMWYLVHRARQDVTVVLTGQGTDEPWGGYFRYQVELLRRRMPYPLLWRFGQQLGFMWRGCPQVIERGLRTLTQNEVCRRIQEAFALFPAHERLLLLGDDDDGGAGNQIASWLAWLDEAGDLTCVEQMMRLDTRMNLSDDLLLYGDKISMAVALEARVPMLDIELIRFVESLPVEYRIRWRQGKIVHKMMAERYLPREIVHRPKKGFQVPFGTWSRGQWRQWVEALLLEGLSGVLCREVLKRIWREHLAQKPDRSRQIFSLLMLALWYQEVDV